MRLPFPPHTPTPIRTTATALCVSGGGGRRRGGRRGRRGRGWYGRCRIRWRRHGHGGVSSKTLSDHGHGVSINHARAQCQCVYRPEAPCSWHDSHGEEGGSGRRASGGAGLDGQACTSKRPDLSAHAWHLWLCWTSLRRSTHCRDEHRRTPRTKRAYHKTTCISSGAHSPLLMWSTCAVQRCAKRKERVYLLYIGLRGVSGLG